ncbi:MAG: LTA synthase family protein [Paludibacter sp.]|nr:LTA synthase family protein [Paludibacter sp.]
MDLLKQFTKKFTDSGNDFIKKSFLFVLLFILARVVEIVWVSSLKTQSAGMGLQFYGMLYDVLFALQIVGYLFLPYLGLSFIKRSIANAFYIILTGLMLIFYLGLIAYFQSTSIPLGADLFAYDFTEIIHIVQAANISIAWFSVIFIVIFGLIVLLYQLTASIRLNNNVQTISFVIILISLFFSGAKADTKYFKSEYDSYLEENKLNFFLTSNLNYFENKLQLESLEHEKIERLANDTTLIDHTIPDETYPFFHKDETPDVLGPFLKVNQSKRPNIIFIIVESLGTAYSGPANYMGSFTPFLDSLASKSLYWKDFVSSSGRTFEVLPTMLGSLPFGKSGFADLKGRDVPNHLTLPRILKEEGYATAFFYGGEANFDNMDIFLKNQKLDHIIDNKSFNKELVKMPSNDKGFSWGYGDQELFKQYLSFAIKEQRTKPVFDVLLTLSMHSPFLLNDQPVYAKKVDERIKQLKLTNEQCDFVKTYKDQFTSIMYFDESLRQFFNVISKRPSFKNTIFVITGDHRMPEIPISNQIDRFHVPLIVYSPMLKRAKTIEAVSSQFDVTPTFVSLLRNSYKMKLPAYCHWIGFDLDTTANFRNRHVYTMMRNKNEFIDILVGNTYLSMNNSYTINSAFDMKQINNAGTTQKLMIRLKQFKQMNIQACRNNKLIPDSIYSKW